MVFEPAVIPGARVRQVAAAGVRFAVQRGGDERAPATPALLLHGIPQTAVMWRELFAELARDRVVIAPDLKGLGRGESKPPYDLASLAAELAALVLHEVDGPVDVVGHGWGGLLAVSLAAARPELVRRLVVLAAPVRRGLLIPLVALPLLPEVAFSLGGRRAVGGMLRHGWRAARPLDPAVRAHYERAYADPGHVRAMLAYYRGLFRSTVRPAPRPQRALVVWGGRDPVAPLSVGDRVARDLGPGTAMTTVPDAGHFVLEEAPEVVVPAVAAFLRAR